MKSIFMGVGGNFIPVGIDYVSDLYKEVTSNHYWHHASDEAAIDKNYAAHFSFIDYLLSTAVRGKKNSLIITV